MWSNMLDVVLLYYGPSLGLCVCGLELDLRGIDLLLVMLRGGRRCVRIAVKVAVSHDGGGDFGGEDAVMGRDGKGSSPEDRERDLPVTV